MRPLRGVISDMLRRRKGPQWNPPRPADAAPPKKTPKLPPGVEGKSLGGRTKKGGK